MFLETQREIKRTGEPGLVSDLRNSQRGVLQQLACATQALGFEKCQRGHADLSLEELSQPGTRKAAAARQSIEREFLREPAAQQVNCLADARVAAALVETGIDGVAEQEHAFQRVDGEFLVPAS